jgi:hypothetical protein
MSSRRVVHEVPSGCKQQDARAESNRFQAGSAHAPTFPLCAVLRDDLDEVR